ncbi:uncharacterized protein LOC112560698 [Pomacea canaliculata]|uniref:uncharacterized protein LOC112560698 n=1 Tax=Pomacea canaliculata TaxID=400727 RepID=UPI000D726073|nr:uncharacterized protein LOC112560698 [Pomacea canaliculata]
MEVTCRAFLGRQTNSIVWESRPPDGQFVLDTDSNINYSTPVDTKSCNYYAESTLSRDLTAADHRREWRCRLSFGQAAATFIVITGSCPSTTTEKFDEGPKAGASSKEKPLLIENQSNLTVILATVIPVSVLTLMVILAMIVLRRHTKQVPPILLFPEGPPPSEYSFSAVAGRGLPPLPQVQSNDYHFSATIDKSSEPPPPLPPSYQHVESADQSVYVSMSAIPGSCDTSSTSCSSARMSETGRLWEDSDDQGMRTERSESTYSNKEAIERAKMLAQAKAKNYNTCFNYLDLLPLEVDKE